MSLAIKQGKVCDNDPALPERDLFVLQVKPLIYHISASASRSRLYAPAIHAAATSKATAESMFAPPQRFVFTGHRL